MKKKIILICTLFFSMGNIYSQSVYDAVNLASEDLNGTARFVGMGGAMGALGGDISTAGSNPAGIGIYRSHDLMTTFGFSNYTTKSNYLGQSMKTDNNRMSFDNIGFVYSSKMSDNSALRFVNFGFNYTRSKSLYNNMSMSGLMGQYGRTYLTQTNSMAQQAEDTDPCKNINFGADDIFDPIYDAGWLAALGWNTHLVNQDLKGDYFSAINNEASATFHSRERGGIDKYDFNIAFNVYDRFYFGMTVGAYDVNYDKDTFYGEDYISANTGEGYALQSWNNIDGTGYDVKFGAIVRPFESSPLRIGVAIHSPIFYDLTYTTSANINSQLYLNGGSTLTTSSVDTYDRVGDYKQDFRLRTPWKYNLSLGYTVGKFLALGAEYEYEDYSTMNFSHTNGDNMDYENNEADLCLKAVNTLRIGAEYKFVPELSFRVGYNYSSAIFKQNAIKALPTNSILTDTDFSNSLSHNNFTFGLGLKISNFYADMAYQYSTYKANFFPFYNEISVDKVNNIVTAEATKVKNEHSQLLLTLGVRF